MKSYLLVSKESIESQARVGVRGTARGERQLQRSTALRFVGAERAAEALQQLGLRSATLPGARPAVSKKEERRGKKGQRGGNVVKAEATPIPGPVQELTGSESGSYRYMPLIGATMAHFYSDNGGEGRAR